MPIMASTAAGLAKQVSLSEGGCAAIWNVDVVTDREHRLPTHVPEEIMCLERTLAASLLCAAVGGAL
eukprot:gene12318-biopygen559